MLSKLVADREQSARVVVAAYETHGPKTSPILNGMLTAHARPGEGAPDVNLFIRLLQRHLEKARQTMSDADLAHTRELSDDPAARDARDVAKASVLSLVTSIRLALTSRFGKDFGGQLGAAGPAPDAPNDVLSWGRKVYDALTSLVLPTANLDDDDNDDVGVFSKDAAVRKLGQRLLQLETALDVVAREGREVEVTQGSKDKAIAAYDTAFTLTAGLLEVFLRFTGEPTLADKVRPSVRRPGTTAASETPSTPEAPAVVDVPAV